MFIGVRPATLLKRDSGAGEFREFLIAPFLTEHIWATSLLNFEIFELFLLLTSLF